MHPEGVIELLVTFGEEPRVVTKIVRFLVVDCSSTNNAILGRRILHELKAIPSIYHQVIKIPSIEGVGLVKGDWQKSRECYYTTLWEVDRKPRVSASLLKLSFMFYFLPFSF